MGMGEAAADQDFKAKQLHEKRGLVAGFLLPIDFVLGLFPNLVETIQLANRGLLLDTRDTFWSIGLG